MASAARAGGADGGGVASAVGVDGACVARAVDGEGVARADGVFCCTATYVDAGWVASAGRASVPQAIPQAMRTGTTRKRPKVRNGGCRINGVSSYRTHCRISEPSHWRIDATMERLYAL